MRPMIVLMQYALEIGASLLVFNYRGVAASSGFPWTAADLVADGTAVRRPFLHGRCVHDGWTDGRMDGHTHAHERHAQTLETCQPCAHHRELQTLRAPPTIIVRIPGIIRDHDTQDSHSP